MFATLHHLTDSHPALRAWHVDSPEDGKAAPVTDAGLLVAGWVLARDPEAVPLMIACAAGDPAEVVKVLPLSQRRPDVIRYMLASEPDGHPQAVCGFWGRVPVARGGITLGVGLGGEFIRLVEVRFTETCPSTPAEPPPKVLRGRDGWLFLDNDTNQSVEQHTGRRLLGEKELAAWRLYLDQCRALAAEVGARHAMLIAAAKSQVLADFYPHAKGSLTVHDQVLGLCELADHVVASAVVLARQRDREACFIKTDTHWTDRGAKYVTLALLQELRLDVAQAERLFAKDKYFTMPFAGDLGSKLHPVQVAETEFLLGPLADADAYFDSGPGNTGRLLRFGSDQALWPGKLLLFGASSAYSLLKYLKRLVAEIVFVHSAGCVDPEFLRRERPDFLVMQTTARYMIVPPNTEFRVEARENLTAASAETAEQG